MKHYFPQQNQTRFLQTNRSDNEGSLWSSFNLDLQSNLGRIKLGKKLVVSTSSSDDATLGLPIAFEYFYNQWWSIAGDKIFKSATKELTSAFSVESVGWTIGDATTQFDITNPGGTTYRYTYDTTGTNPNITATSIPIGASVTTAAQNFAAGNNGTFTVTGSGSNYFEVTNASGAVESNKTIGTGYISVTGGTQGVMVTTSDMKVFNDKLWVANNNEGLYSKDTASGIWTKRDNFGSGFVTHQMAYFKKFDRLYYIASSTAINSVDTDSVVDSSTTYYLNAGKSVGWLSGIVATSNYLWIYSMTDNSGNSDADSSKTQGIISQWDGYSQQVTNEFPIQASGILAMCVLDDVPYAIDSEGRILGFTGSSFKEITRLPIDKKLLKNSSVSYYLSNRFVHFNGFIPTKNNTLLVLINNLNGNNTADVTENMSSGVWELDLATQNFTHKHSASLKTLASSSQTDFGQNKVSAVGALKLNPFESSSTSGRSDLVAGLTVYSNATTTLPAIFITAPNDASTDNEKQKTGYFITTWFESSEITDTWNRIWVTFKRFLNSTDKIILKYRTTDETPTEATIIWVNTTQFTTTTDVSAYANDATGFDGTYGGEVEILQGTGAGACRQITSVINNAGTYTVLLDNTVTGVTTGTAKARFQKWHKILPEITGQTLQYGQTSLSISDTKIQVKGVMEFTGDDEFHKMIIVSSPSLEAKP